jgi:hypothetical protein
MAGPAIRRYRLRLNLHGPLQLDHFWYALALGGILAVANVVHTLVL